MVELHGVLVRVAGVEHSHEIVHIAHRHGEGAGGEVADALRVQHVEQGAEFDRRWNAAKSNIRILDTYRVAIQIDSNFKPPIDTKTYIAF